MDRPHQVGLAEWLGEKVHRSCLERAHGARNVPVSGDEHDLWVRLARHLALQIEAVDVGQVHVQDQAARQVRLREFQVLGGRPERDDVQVCRRQQLLECLARSEEHTSELQSLAYLVCRLLLEKKKKYTSRRHSSLSARRHPQPTHSPSRQLKSQIPSRKLLSLTSSR